MAVFRPREFHYSDDWDSALRTLRDNGKHAHVIAGGTGFYELARRGYIPEVKQIVSIMKLGLSYVKRGSDAVSIGATTTLEDLANSGISDVEGAEAVLDALKEIRPLQVRNVATVGGEVCIAVPIVDLPTALIACDASLVIVGYEKSEERRRVLPLDQFYLDAFLTALRYGEIVKEVVLPKRGDGQRSAFVKLGRTAYDFNLVNAAASLRLAKDGVTISSLKVILGGISRTPIRAERFERRLVGKKIEEKTIVEAAESGALAKDESLLPSVHGSSEYKAAVLPIVLRDCILKAYKRCLGSTQGRISGG